MPPSPPITLDAYVLDALLPDLVGHDRHPSAFLVYLVLWQLSSAKPGRPSGASVAVALQDIAERTGLSKRAVQDAIGRLVERELLVVRRASPTAVSTFTVLRPWAARRRQ